MPATNKKAAPATKKAVAPKKKATQPAKKVVKPTTKQTTPAKKAAPATKKVSVTKKSAQPVKKATAATKKAVAPSKKSAQPVKKANQQAAAKKAASAKKSATKKIAKKLAITPVIKKSKFAKIRKTKSGQFKSKTKHLVRFVIDCTAGVEDGLIDLAAFEKFLHDRIKINGKTGALGNNVRITRDKKRLTINAIPPFSKRSLKFLAKKFFKKHDLRDWIRLVATNKTTYTVKYYAIDNKDEDEVEQTD
eukprot:TRINITY_DN70_c0_g1_i4.p1 TRINITY_DN70_c0_g1~~TRINITY_DN70_c0_g1_i4.p1  ORF type:complete len:248 (+),score=145.26 TRINITY_DN70_c0_g1_i4:165-908(+)